MVKTGLLGCSKPCRLCPTQSAKTSVGCFPWVYYQSWETKGSLQGQGTELISGKGRQDFSPGLVDILLCGAERKTLTPAWFFASMNTQHRLWQNVTRAGDVMDPGAWVWPCLGVASVPSTRQAWATQTMVALSLWSPLQVLACDPLCLAPHSSWAESLVYLCRSAPDKYWPENLA